MSMITNYRNLALGEVDPSHFYRAAEAAWYYGRKAARRASEIMKEEPSFPGTGGKRKLPLGEPPKKVSQIKMGRGTGMRAVNTVNQLAGRASMKRTGSKNIKPKGKKRVRVSKTLRKKVEKVLETKKVYGEYHKCFNGNVGVYYASAADPTGTVNGTTVKLSHGPYYSDNNSFSYTHWNHLASGQWDCNGTGAYQAGKGLVFFTPLKFLDAASILWNKRTVGLDSGASTSTLLNTRVIESTGVAPAIVKPMNLKLDVVNSYVQFKIKNQSQRTQYIVIHHCAPKIKACLLDPLTNLETAMISDCSDNGPVGSIASEPDSIRLSNPLIPWSAYPSFNANWKYEKVELVIKAGETCEHSLKGPRNYTIDYAKLNLNGEFELEAFWKGSVWATISVLPDVVSTQSPPNNVGHNVPYTDAITAKNLKDPVSVEVFETYKLRMPEPTGFITKSNLAAGEPLPLNLRRPRKVYGNFMNNFVGTGAAYPIIEEETPATTISGGDRA